MPPGALTARRWSRSAGTATPSRPASRGCARPQNPREDLPPAAGQQRVEPEPALAMVSRPLLLGMDRDRCRVEVEDHTPRCCARLPRPSASDRARLAPRLRTALSTGQLATLADTLETQERQPLDQSLRPFGEAGGSQSRAGLSQSCGWASRRAQQLAEVQRASWSG